MIATKTEFPNPVLADGRDDYIESCYFRTFLNVEDITVDKHNIVIPIRYEIKCDGLQKLIDSGEAVAIISVKSSAASYSRIFTFPAYKTGMTIEIPKYDVVTKIDVTCSVIAAQDIKNFTCPGEFNELYFGGIAFEIRKGDILATEDSRTIYLDDSELEKPISSIFSISEKNDIPTDIYPDFEGTKIIIYLKKELYEIYYHFKDVNNGALRRYLTGVIVYPVLVEAVDIVLSSKSEDDDNVSNNNYSSLRWFRAIKLKIDESANKFDNPYDEHATVLADYLLGGISSDALKSFKNVIENEINSGEGQMTGGID